MLPGIYYLIPERKSSVFLDKPTNEALARIGVASYKTK
jgi:hypothetical protein